MLAALALAACKDDKKAPALEASASAPIATLSAPPATAPPAGMNAPMALALDGGACAVDVGPFGMDFVGAPTIVLQPGGADIIGNDDGAAHAISISGGKAPAMPGVRVTGSRLPCAAARARVFCPSAGGKIHEGSKVIAQGMPGARIAAAEVGGHAVVAYIEEKKSSEGMTRVARIWSDDGKTQLLSEEGNGATFVDLAARDGQVVALTIDAHMGMTPIHARTLEWSGKLALGADAVLMVAGNAEAHTEGTLATKHDKGPSFALVPIAKDISAFGAVAIRIDAPPKMDAPQQWSLYDNGLDPAPIAATRDGARMYVARVRPQGKLAGAPRVLELGALDDRGVFSSFGAIRGAVSSVAVAADAAGVWIAYSDASHATAEHRRCP